NSFSHIIGYITMPHYLNAGILFRETGQTGYGGYASQLDVSGVLYYVAKTGITEFYIQTIDFLHLGGYIKRYCGISGNTEEGYPYFQFLGMKFILLCGDKLKAFNLLK